MYGYCVTLITECYARLCIIFREKVFWLTYGAVYCKRKRKSLLTDLQSCMVQEEEEKSVDWLTELYGAEEKSVDWLTELCGARGRGKVCWQTERTVLCKRKRKSLLTDLRSCMVQEEEETSVDWLTELYGARGKVLTDLRSCMVQEEQEKSVDWLTELYGARERGKVCWMTYRAVPEEEEKSVDWLTELYGARGKVLTDLRSCMVQEEEEKSFDWLTEVYGARGRGEVCWPTYRAVQEEEEKSVDWLTELYGARRKVLRGSGLVVMLLSKFVPLPTYMSGHKSEPTNWPVHPAKTQISLGILPILFRVSAVRF